MNMRFNFPLRLSALNQDSGTLNSTVMFSSRIINIKTTLLQAGSSKNTCHSDFVVPFSYLMKSSTLPQTRVTALLRSALKSYIRFIENLPVLRFVQFRLCIWLIFHISILVSLIQFVVLQLLDLRCRFPVLSLQLEYLNREERMDVNELLVLFCK